MLHSDCTMYKRSVECGGVSVEVGLLVGSDEEAVDTARYGRPYAARRLQNARTSPNLRVHCWITLHGAISRPMAIDWMGRKRQPKTFGHQTVIHTFLLIEGVWRAVLLRLVEKLNRPEQRRSSGCLSFVCFPTRAPELFLTLVSKRRPPLLIKKFLPYLI